MIDLPENLFDGTNIRSDIDLKEVQLYKVKLEAYLVISEQREDSSEEVDEADYERLHQ